MRLGTIGLKHLVFMSTPFNSMVQKTLQLIAQLLDFSTPGTSLSKTRLLTSANEIAHKEGGRPPYDIIFGDFSHMPLVLYRNLWMVHYIWISTNCESVFKIQIGISIGAIPMAAVTGEVNYYYRHRSFPRFAETLCLGCNTAVQFSMVCGDNQIWVQYCSAIIPGLRR